MAFKLQADNRVLLTEAKYSYLSTNYASGSGSVVALDARDFATDDYVLLGNFGSESSEILRVDSVTQSTRTITFDDDAGSDVNTAFAHPESTRITIIPYSQVSFYYTVAETYDTDTAVSENVPIQTSSWYTQADDDSHTSGFGWFVFYNPATDVTSQNSNAIPYAGVTSDGTQKIIASFFSLLNNKELKNVSMEDAYTWLNEGFSIAMNDLNNVNTEYNVSDETSIAVVSGTAEYTLETDFSNLIYIREVAADGTSGYNIEPIQFNEIANYLVSGVTTPRYYLRGNKIGFVPTPIESATYKYRYQAKATELTTFDDSVTLPDNGHLALLDWMLYRAFMKSHDPNSSIHYQRFDDWLKRNKISSITRDNRPGSWGFSSTSIV